MIDRRSLETPSRSQVAAALTPSPHSSGPQQSLALAVSNYCRPWIARSPLMLRVAGSLANTNAHTDKETRSTRTTPTIPEHVRLCGQAIHDASRYRA